MEAISCVHKPLNGTRTKQGHEAGQPRSPASCLRRIPLGAVSPSLRPKLASCPVQPGGLGLPPEKSSLRHKRTGPCGPDEAAAGFRCRSRNTLEYSQSDRRQLRRQRAFLYGAVRRAEAGFCRLRRIQSFPGFPATSDNFRCFRRQRSWQFS